MKKLLLLVSALFACGGYDDGYEELGEVEQPYSLAVASGAGSRMLLGFDLQSTHDQKCTTVMTSTNTCVLPPDFVVTVGSTDPFIKGFLPNLVQRINREIGLSAGGRWSISVVDSNPEFAVERQNLSALGADSITSYSQVFCTNSGGTPLTEPTALNGTFVKYGNCIAGIDVIDIHARGANGTEDTNLMIHAILHALLKATGTGADVGDTDGYASSTRITPLTSQKMTMSAGEKCRANNSSPQIGTTSASKVTLSTSAGCGND